MTIDDQMWLLQSGNGKIVTHDDTIGDVLEGYLLFGKNFKQAVYEAIKAQRITIERRS